MSGSAIPPGYQEVTDPEVRAMVLAFYIRQGVRIEVGQFVGFSHTLRIVDLPSDFVETGLHSTDLSKCEQYGEKLWMCFYPTITDFDNARALIGSQKMTYRGHGESASGVLRCQDGSPIVMDGKKKR